MGQQAIDELSQIAIWLSFALPNQRCSGFRNTENTLIQGRPKFHYYFDDSLDNDDSLLVDKFGDKLLLFSKFSTNGKHFLATAKILARGSSEKLRDRARDMSNSTFQTDVQKGKG